MIGILFTVSFLIWSALALTYLPEHPDFSTLSIWRPKHPIVVLLALLVGIFGFYVRWYFSEQKEIDHWFCAFIIDLAPEMVGIAFTVVVIDELNQRRLDQQEKDRLFAQVKNPVRDMAVEALRLIRENNWLSEVLKKYEYDLGAVQWQGANLSGAHLPETNLLGAHLGGADLSKANLQKADLSEANLQGVDLSEANLQESNLREANLQGAILGGANLKKAGLVSTNLEESVFEEANLQGAYLQGAYLQGANLIHTNFERANLSSTNLQGAYLLLANLHGADLSSANLEKASLYGANLQGANLSRANLHGSNLRWVDGQGVDLIGANLGETDLEEARLQGAKYSSKTTWPDGFDPQKAGAIKEAQEEICDDLF